MIKHNILLIDDDRDLVRLTEKYLKEEGYQVTSRYDGAEGLTTALENEFQLIILDVMLPLLNGFELLQRLREKSSVPVLMLTAKSGDADKIAGLRMGADDYLSKPFNMSELLARVSSLIRRYTVLNGNFNREPVSCFRFEADPETRVFKKDGKIIEVTAKEFDLLYFFMKNKEKVFTKKLIYRAVWEDEYAYDDNNIMVHIRRLRKRIEENPDEPKYIQTVWGVGYKFGDAND